MKKILLILIFCLMLSGCGSSKKIDSSKGVEQEDIDDESKSLNIPATDLIEKKEYNLGTGESLILGTFEEDGSSVLMIVVNIPDEKRASLVFGYLHSIAEGGENQGLHSSIWVTCASGMVGMTPNGKIIGTNKDGSSVVELPDWIIDDTSEYLDDETEYETLLQDVKNCLLDFK